MKIKQRKGFGYYFGVALAGVIIVANGTFIGNIASVDAQKWEYHQEQKAEHAKWDAFMKEAEKQHQEEMEKLHKAKPVPHAVPSNMHKV